jgi:hypothetical protein
LRFLLGGEPEHEFTGDPLALVDNLRELLGCKVGYSRHHPVGRRWVDDHAESALVTIVLEVTGTSLGPDAVRGAILSELARLGHGDVTVQLDT